MTIGEGKLGALNAMPLMTANNDFFSFSLMFYIIRTLCSEPSKANQALSNTAGQKTKIPRGTPRVLMQLKLIGYGQGHRQKYHNETTCQRILQQFFNIK
jgi:hypothetical protein